MAQRLISSQQVGRAAEMATLEALLADARSGVRFAAVSGEAGIGKSRLLMELTATARASGLSVHIGGCPPPVDGPPIPFAAITQALRSILRSVDARSLDGLPEAARRELARLLPEVDAAGSDSLSSTRDGAARLYEAVLLLIERAAGTNGTVLVLEDMHWSDGPTRTLLSHLCRNLGDAPVLVIVSYRPEALPPHDALPGLLLELARVPGGGLLHLAPLSPSDARTLVDLVAAGARTEDELVGIVRRAAGVPLYLEELALSPTRHAEASTPASLRASVGNRLAGLTTEARLLVEVVAVSGGPTDTRLVTRASGLKEMVAAPALREAIEHHLVVGAGEDGQQADIRHGLVREAVLANMVPGEQRRLHGMLASGMLERPSWGSGTESERASWLAQHLLAAGDEQRAVPVLLRVADASRRALAFDDADRAYERALGIVGDTPPPFPPVQWAVILTSAASAARLAGHPDRAVTLQERAIALEDQRSDPLAMSMARVHLGRYFAEAGRHREALDVLADAATGTSDPSVRLRAHMEQVRILLLVQDHEAAAHRARLAVALARETGAEREAARACAALGVALSMSGRHTEALAALSESRRIPRAADQDDVTQPSRFPDSLLGYVDAATVLARAGEVDAATRAALDGLAAARRLHLAGSWGQALSATAARELLRQGRWEEASQALDANDSEGRGGPFAALVRATLDTRRGDVTDAEALLHEVTQADLLSAPGYGWLVMRAVAVAEIELSRSNTNEARRAITDGLLAADLDNDRVQRAEVALLGLRIEADAATAARDRRDLTSIEACEQAGQALSAQASSDIAGEARG